MKYNDPIQNRINEIIKNNPKLTPADFNYSVNPNNFRCMEWDVEFTKLGRGMLHRAISELNFSEDELQVFEQILIGIMHVDKTSTAGPEHVAEAIQYVNPRGK